MILVVGARASGKRTFVRSLGYGQAQCSRDAREAVPVLLDLQESVRGWLSDGTYAPDGELPACLRGKEVVCCTEVGSGVVPLGESERRWRDAVGLVSNRLAQEAECVVRMVCGIPLAIKGELPRGPVPHDGDGAGMAGGAPSWS